MIQIRDLEAADSARLFDWRRAPDVDRWMAAAPPADMAAHQRWFDAFLGDPEGRKGWIITLRDAPCGFLALSGVSRENRHAEWSWYIGDTNARGRGAGRAAQALGLERAFQDFRLEKVWSRVIAGNDAALKVQAAAGFRREGYLRRHVCKNEQFHDVVLLGVLREEWAARREGALRDLQRSGLLAV